jgi:hypothetical protein
MKFLNLFYIPAHLFQTEGGGGDILETICQKKGEMMKWQGTRIYCSVDSLRKCQMGE